jgi:hypothetical protein
MQKFALCWVGIQMYIVTSSGSLPSEELQLLYVWGLARVTEKVISRKPSLDASLVLMTIMGMKATHTSSGGRFLLGASRIERVLGS